MAVAAAEATVKALADEDVASNAREVGVYLRTCLASLPQVTEVRGLGLMVAADLDKGFDAFGVVARGLDAGLLLNATGPHTLRFLPPLVCSEADVDALIERLRTLLVAEKGIAH